MLIPLLIPPDYPNQHAIAAIAASLSGTLQDIDEICDKIESRLHDCDVRSKQIDQRVNVIKKKLQNLQSVENAGLTFPTRYPDTHHQSIAPVLANSVCGQRLSTPFSSSPSPLLTDQFLLNAVHRKKGFNYAFGKGKHDEAFKALSQVHDENSWGDILNNELIFAETSNLLQTTDKAGIDAESLLLYSSVGHDANADPFAYKPELGSLNAFDFPDSLPQLQGVSLNIVPNNDWIFPSIAPSAKEHISNNEKRTCVDLTTPSGIYYQNHVTPIQNTNSTNSVNHDAPLAADTRDTIPVEVQANHVEKVDDKPADVIIKNHDQVPETHVVPAPTTTSPPPPPPPPPPPLSLLPALPSISQERSDMLAHIRAIGGSEHAKLRSVAKPEAAPAKAKAETILPDTGDDLMGSLARALELRRKVISGNQKSRTAKANRQAPVQQSTTGEAFSRLRNSIPVIQNDVRNGNDDDEWN